MMSKIIKKKISCSDRENCLLMAQCIEGGSIIRKKMESDNSFYYSPEVKMKFIFDDGYTQQEEMFIMYCPFCGYRYGSQI